MSGNESGRALDTNFIKIVKLIQTTVPSYDEKPELFKKLLDDKFDVEYRIPENDNNFQTNWLVGCTIFQIIYSNTRMSQALIDRGADYTVRDKEGSTILLKEASSRYKFYLTSKLRTYPKDKLYADVILSAHLDFKNPTNPKDKRGLSHFHIACMYNRADAAKFFLDNGVPINETVNQDSKFYPGYSALHFAVKSCAFEIADLLLTMGADMFAKDSKGMSPLHVLMIDRKDICVILKRLSRIAHGDWQKSKYLDLKHYYIEDEKLVYLFLERMNRCKLTISDHTGLTYFHGLCFMGNTSNITNFLENNIDTLVQSVSKDSPIWPGYTPLHFAAHSNVETVELLVKMGADLSTKDEKGVTPFDICLREFTIADVHRIFLMQPDYSTIVFSDGKTKLCDFICVMQETATFENFLKDNLTEPNMFIPFNSPLCAGYTPLHLIVMCIEQPMSWSTKNPDNPHDLFRDLASKESQIYLSRVESYLRYNPEVTTRDTRGFTPLHWAFRLQQSKAVHLILERHETSSNYVDEDGLSHLHIACAANDETVVRKLLEGGANVNGITTSSYTWINVTVGYTTESVLDKNQARKHFINESSTPLHFAATARCPKIVEILLDHHADVLAKDAKGLNPLERILKEQIFEDAACPKPNIFRVFKDDEKESIELLVRRIGDRLAATKPKQMLSCYNFLEDKLLSEILSHNDESAMKILEGVGITALHVACFTRNSMQVNELVKRIDVNARVILESPLWPGCTPLHLFARERLKDSLDAKPSNKVIVEKLLLRGADVIARNLKGDTPIHQIFHHSWYHLGRMLSYLKDFSVNPMGRKGLNHLHIMSACGATSIVERFLEHGAIVDEPTNYFADEVGGFTALHLAAAYRQNAVIKVLLKHGADVNWKNCYGGNALHAANGEDRQPCLDVLRTLIGAGTDIHARNMYGETPLEALMNAYVCDEEEVELFVTSGSRVNTVNPMNDDGLLAIILNKSKLQPFFELAIKASDVSHIDHDGRNAIHNVVTLKRPEWTAFEHYSIDEKYTAPEKYIEAIASLLKLHLNIDQQDRKGTTPLHIAAQMQNLTGTIGLLENGADINLTDADGQPAFVYCLELAQLHEELMELDKRILKVISTHIHKLSIARIGISQANREVYATILETVLLDVSKVTEYRGEVGRMKEEQIYSTSVALREFLSDTWAVSAFPYLLPCKKNAIDYFFRNEVANLREQFPESTGILLLQYRKALARSDMMNPALDSLNHLAGFDVPAICSRIILRFLSNDDLSNMVISTTIQ